MTEGRVLVVNRKTGTLARSFGNSWFDSAGLKMSLADVEQATCAVSNDQLSAVLFLQTAHDECYDVARILSACTSTRRPVPVVVVVDQYNEAEALTYFQMGVAEYLSLRDHKDRIATIVHSLASKSQLISPDQAGVCDAPTKSWGVSTRVGSSLVF